MTLDDRSAPSTELAVEGPELSEDARGQEPFASPPRARRVPQEVRLHGETFDDPWSWMRDKDDPALRAYLEDENEWTRRAMAPTQALQNRIYEEILGRIRETDLSVPWRFGRHDYFSRTEEGKQYPIFCRRPVTGGADQVIIDQNALAEGRAYLGIGVIEISADEKVIAFTTDYTGFREYTLRFRDLESGAWLEDTIENVSDIVWAKDSRTLYYTTEDEAKRPYQVWRHRLGEPDDVLIHEEADALYHVGLHGSRDRQWGFITTGSATTSDVHALRLDESNPEPVLIAAREEDHEYYADHAHGLFFILTNDRGRNFRLATAPAGSPGREQWTELIAHSDDSMLEHVDLFARHLIVWERCRGVERLRVRELASGAEHFVAFSEPVYSIVEETNEEFDTSRFRFNYQSFVTPPSVIEYDLDARTQTVLKRTDVLGGWDASRYETERLEATARDGTRIPISLVRLRGQEHRGPAPMLLYGYGAYGIPLQVTFGSERFSLIDRGVAFAIAHVRGGGEMGKPWHDQGRMAAKKNTFTDFIAVAEFLIADGRTTPDRLVIEGGSAGGLLMGVVTNMRPDLWRAVVAKVPFVDVTNTMLDASLPLTVGEYLEWGNPNVESEYRLIRPYDPYLNIEPRDYPAMLVRTSWNDSQVMVWEAAKYVAKLRTVWRGDRALLLRTNLEAGHGGFSSRYDRYREVAFDYAFVLRELE